MTQVFVQNDHNSMIVSRKVSDIEKNTVETKVRIKMNDCAHCANVV